MTNKAIPAKIDKQVIIFHSIDVKSINSLITPMIRICKVYTKIIVRPATGINVQKDQQRIIGFYCYDVAKMMQLPSIAI